jgi:uncharacterized membrane protein
MEFVTHFGESGYQTCVCASELTSLAFSKVFLSSEAMCSNAVYITTTVPSIINHRHGGDIVERFPADSTKDNVEHWQYHVRITPSIVTLISTSYFIHRTFAMRDIINFSP